MARARDVLQRERARSRQRRRSAPSPLASARNVGLKGVRDSRVGEPAFLFCSCCLGDPREFPDLFRERMKKASQVNRREYEPRLEGTAARRIYSVARRAAFACRALESPIICVMAKKKKKKRSGRARCCCWPAQWSERPTSAGPFSATLTCVCTRAQLDTTHSHTHTRGAALLRERRCSSLLFGALCGASYLAKQLERE